MLFARCAPANIVIYTPDAKSDIYIVNERNFGRQKFFGWIAADGDAGDEAHIMKRETAAEF